MHLVSFTFGCPTPAIVDRLHRADIRVAITVTSGFEAQRAADVGTDFLAVQGTEAGGHQGRFAHLDTNQRPLLPLLAEIRATTDLPVIGAGGIMTGRQAAEVFAAGAIAVQLGTAFLCTPEAGTSAPYRRALLDQRYPDTIVTRAYSGAMPGAWRTGSGWSTTSRPRRLIRRFTISPARCAFAATRAGDDTVPNLWAGTGWAEIRAAPAATVVRRIAADAWPSAR